jgi:hypothetical protein
VFNYFNDAGPCITPSAWGLTDESHRSGLPGLMGITVTHVVCGVPPCDVCVPGPAHCASGGLVVAIDAAAMTAGATVLSKKLRTILLRVMKLLPVCFPTSP